MPVWLRNERVLIWLAVIIGSIPTVFIIPIVDKLLPGVVWWPGAWLLVLAFTGVLLIALFTRHP